MRNMSRVCALISTSEQDATLAELLLKKDNTFGPMGSGGYGIRRSDGGPEGSIEIVFRQMDCAPAPEHSVFIKDGQIWVTHVRSFVMSTLSYAGISFAHEQIDSPSFILDYISALPA